MLHVSHLGFLVMVKIVFVQQGDGPCKSLVNKLDYSAYINYSLHTLQHVIKSLETSQPVTQHPSPVTYFILQQAMNARACLGSRAQCKGAG